MRRVAAVLSTVAMLLVATSAFAQGKNFAGKWAPDAEKNAAAMAGGGGGGRQAGGGGGGGGRQGGGGGDMTVTQDAKTLTITRTTQAGETKTVYNLDGTETTVPMGRGGEGKAKTAWEGDKLVITTTGGNGEQKVTWYLEGGELVQERAGQNGTTKTYYKKAM